jgi:hypothetical protein
MSDSTDSSSSNLSETVGGFDIMAILSGDLMQVSSAASSCTILILCIIMIAVLANKSYCKN